MQARSWGIWGFTLFGLVIGLYFLWEVIRCRVQCSGGQDLCAGGARGEVDWRFTKKESLAGAGSRSRCRV